MNNLIIGGGISGLIWNYYHPDYKIITPEIGGDYSKINMTWLHDTPETRSLIKSLDFVKEFNEIENIQKKSYIGYSIKNSIYKNINDEMNSLLILKKITEWNKEINRSFKIKSKKMSMSEGKNSENFMKTLNINLKELIERLEKKAKIIPGLVSSISDCEITIQQISDSSKEKKMKYNKIVSTIPAPIFWEKYNKIKKFRFLPITIIQTSVKPVFFDNFFEIIYYDNSVPFSRISYLDNKYTIEFTGIIEKNIFEKMYPNLFIDNYSVIKYGRLFEDNKNNTPSSNIKFLGRFAEWKFKITTEHIIKEAITSSF